MGWSNGEVGGVRYRVRWVGGVGLTTLLFIFSREYFQPFDVTSC